MKWSHVFRPKEVPEKPPLPLQPFVEPAFPLHATDILKEMLGGVYPFAGYKKFAFPALADNAFIFALRNPPNSEAILVMTYGYFLISNARDAAIGRVTTALLDAWTPDSYPKVRSRGWKTQEPHGVLAFYDRYDWVGVFIADYPWHRFLWLPANTPTQLEDVFIAAEPGTSIIMFIGPVQLADVGVMNIEWWEISMEALP